MAVAERYDELSMLYRAMSMLAADISAALTAIEDNKQEMHRCVLRLSTLMAKLDTLWQRASLTVRYDKEEVMPLDTQSIHESS